MNIFKTTLIMLVGIIMVLSSLAGCKGESVPVTKTSQESEENEKITNSNGIQEIDDEEEIDQPVIKPEEEAPAEESEPVVPETVEFTLTCISFEDGGVLPDRHSYYGGNKSPELDWTGKPEGTVSLALVVDDPDGGNWCHLITFNLGVDIEGLGEDQPPFDVLGDGAKQGKNDFGGLGWGGPCPPSGTHRYYFRLYALDSMLDLPAGATMSQVQAAMEGHILDTAALMGTYSASN